MNAIAALFLCCLFPLLYRINRRFSHASESGTIWWKSKKPLCHKPPFPTPLPRALPERGHSLPLNCLLVSPPPTHTHTHCTYSEIFSCLRKRDDLMEVKKALVTLVSQTPLPNSPPSCTAWKGAPPPTELLTGEPPLHTHTLHLCIVHAVTSRHKMRGLNAHSRPCFVFCKLVCWRLANNKKRLWRGAASCRQQKFRPSLAWLSSANATRLLNLVWCFVLQRRCSWIHWRPSSTWRWLERRLSYLDSYWYVAQVLSDLLTPWCFARIWNNWFHSFNIPVSESVIFGLGEESLGRRSKVALTKTGCLWESRQ